MKREPDFDFFAVARQHWEIHEKLCQWALYIVPKRKNGAQHPMWRTFIPGSNGSSETSSEAVDPLECHRLEKAVTALPEKNAWAIRWAYVGPWGVRPYNMEPRKACQRLAVTRAGLALLVQDGRSMLKNRSNT